MAKSTHSNRKELKNIANALSGLTSIIKRKSVNSRSQEFGKHFLSLGNLAVSVIVFVQFLPSAQFSIQASLIGIVAFGVFYAIGFYLMGGDDS